jgi:hypothetical protein
MEGVVVSYEFILRPNDRTAGLYSSADGFEMRLINPYVFPRYEVRCVPPT